MPVVAKAADTDPSPWAAWRKPRSSFIFYGLADGSAWLMLQQVAWPKSPEHFPPCHRHVADGVIDAKQGVIVLFVSFDTVRAEIHMDDNHLRRPSVREDCRAQAVEFQRKTSRDRVDPQK
ncbi:hypothetical protein [Variovorax sp. J22R115]|uniref:hypothetical protein n=1 Tax=Variovorax sp. J22R115 TaxID=3053509 RepID=UPI0025774EB1|nr:hypothetical protein [Variovorax sp. J22R115]MDM0053899.1 hypothetical protein [Variovorax sp. J22R115]